jgi:ribosomal protein S18 acetylase RimI-like enzyme
MTLSIRPTEPDDAPHLTRWFLQPDVLQYFPMDNVREVEDAVGVWMGCVKVEAGLTACMDGAPCGMATLYVAPYEKLRHQSLFSILVDEQLRGKGVGTQLIRGLKNLAIEKFNLEILHLEVYEGNPAIRLYRREGFKEFGRQAHFIKEQAAPEQQPRYRAKLYMQLQLQKREV